MPWKGSDTGLFLRCRHVSWLKRTLNILGQGQGRWRTSATGTRHDWPISPSAPDRPGVHGVSSLVPSPLRPFGIMPRPTPNHALAQP
ncbi:hypothetical protein COCMIDRAFT_92773 [Bipolaris oryzae ATCC 44560]|uniref:Uncharacterized protein n=1 Tax=Bipolaris oryzae ATCC 44560 TaxID=930090 RepID=W6Z9H5_COCMI|nr:uncharacterized protein COCMIDRAFT_92773 [Bipolaris oryzae ATCC 44560]EUC46433.1 hypothetical protein COCMIDRAFT_92773 [Bipolaris oryzae ATCC 44560]